MNISEMDINDIEERRAQIAEEMNADGANIDALLTEARALLDRKTQLASEEEERRKARRKRRSRQDRKNNRRTQGGTQDGY